MNTKLKEYIKDLVKEQYTNEILDDSIQSLSLAFELCDPKQGYEQHVINVKNASWENLTQEIINLLLSYEKFLKNIWRISHNDEDIEGNSLYRILTDDRFFGFFPDIHKDPEYCGNSHHSIQDINPDELVTYFRNHRDLYDVNRISKYAADYFRVYIFRNSSTHSSMQGSDISPRGLTYGNRHKVLQSILTTYLDVCYKYRKEINNYADQRFLTPAHRKFNNIAESIINDHKQLSSQYSYIDFGWTGESEESINQINMIADLPNNAIKLVGEAGIGKTTALKELEYLIAKRYRDDNKQKMPVFVELKKLKADKNKNIIVQYIHNKWDLTDDEIIMLIKTNSLFLLFDGYNEILNDEILDKFDASLDEIRYCNQQQKIVLTDRDISREFRTILYDATVLQLQPISIENKRKYFRENCKDNDIKQLIEQKLDSDPDYFDELNTPYKLLQFLSVVKNDHTIPQNRKEMTKRYIEDLINRERVEKRDTTAAFIPVFLEHLALDTREYLSYTGLIVFFGKVADKCKLRNIDTSKIIDLVVGMNLLKNENNQIAFYSDDYLIYFFGFSRKG